MKRLATLCLCTFAALPPALADMAFYVVNNHTSDVALEIFSQDSDRVWPGGDDVYLFEARKKKSVTIDCEPGEKVCYGAWIKGNDRISWGVGPDNAYDCKGCCRICVSSGMDEIHIPGD